MVTAICSVVRHGHTEFVNLHKQVMQAMGWRRGDKLVAVIWEDQVILKKLPMGAMADQVAGAMLRRKRGEEKKHNEGAWDRKRQRGQPEP